MTILWHPFVWEGETLGERYFPHAAMYVEGVLPALDNLAGWYQFDLGAPRSMLYGQVFTPEQQTRIETHILPGRRATINGQPYPLLDLSLQVGPWTLDSGLVWFSDFGDPEPSPEGRINIGTVGVDFVGRAVLALDYPRQRLSRLAAVPPNWEEQAYWIPLSVTEQGLILIQVRVDDQPTWLGFDTGSSIFHLLTDDEHWKRWTDGVVEETLPIHAWGKILTVYGAPPRVSLSLGDHSLDVPLVYYRSDSGWSEFLQRFDVGGLMGNAPFLDAMIVLDFPGERLGVIR